MAEMPPWPVIRGEDLLLRVKAVPGARRSEVAGPLGDRLKVRVAAPPEDGKANAALLRLLAGVLGVEERAIELEQGAGAAAKTFAIRGGASHARRVRAALSPWSGAAEPEPPSPDRPA
jgi:uncharacterized protein (TIGR00251 family)